MGLQGNKRKIFSLHLVLIFLTRGFGRRCFELFFLGHLLFGTRTHFKRGNVLGSVKFDWESGSQFSGKEMNIWNLRLRQLLEERRKQRP